MWRRRIIGIEMGSSSVKVVELLLGAGRRKTIGRTALLQGTGELGEFLKGELKLKPSDPIHVGFPSEKVAVHPVSLPFEKPSRVLQTLPYELEGDLPFSPEEMVVGYIPTGVKWDGQNQFLAFAVPVEAVEENLRGLKALGLDPRVLEPELVALARLAGEGISGAPPSFALLDMGSSKTNLVLCRDGSPVYMRCIPSQWEGEGESISPELTREIERTFRSVTFRGEASWPRAIYVCGGIVENEKAWTILKGLWDTPVEPMRISMMAGGRICISAEIPEHRFCIALGLALHGTDGKGVSNLRTGIFEYRPGLGAMKKKVALGTASILLGLATGLAWLEAEVDVRQRKLDALQKETRAIFRKAFPEVTQIVDPVLQMQRLLEEKKARHLTLLAQDPKTTVIELLRELSVKEQARTLRITELDLTGDSINIRGEASSYDVIEKAKNHWSASSMIESVEVKNAKKNPKSNLWDFQCTAKRKTS
jgi:type II secretory pathway component PulL